MSAFPTVILEEDAMYWVKPAYGPGEGKWTVARWFAGSFWSPNGNELRPTVISGPIPRPTDEGAQ